MAREQALRIRTDTTLNDLQRETTLTRIHAETRTAVTGVLGEKAATAYFEKPVAKRWLDGIAPVRGQAQPVGDRIRQ